MAVCMHQGHNVSFCVTHSSEKLYYLIYLVLPKITYLPSLYSPFP